MTFSSRFYRIAAVCSVLSAVTTLGLIFLPDFFAPSEGFAGRMARVNDPAYQLRAWVYFVHPFLTWFAAFAVVMRLRKHATDLVMPALAGFSLWAATEAAQQALTLAVFDKWRLAYLAGDAGVVATMELRTAMYDGLWDAMYFLILVAFLIANVLLATVMWRGRGLARLLSVLYAGASFLTLSLFSVEAGGPALIPAALGPWVYPAIQPLARTLIGVWLWRHADEAAGDPLATRG